MFGDTNCGLYSQPFIDLGLKQYEPTVIMEDNQACIARSNNPIMHKRTKHIDVRFHFVREKVESKEVELVHIPTQHQLAEILTKPLSNIRLAMILNRMMVLVLIGIWRKLWDKL